MKKWQSALRENWGLKLISLVLAFVLWLVVAQIDNPKEKVHFNNVRVQLINTDLLEDENKVYEILDNSDYVRVTVTAPRSVTSTLSASDIIAEADLSKITEINTVPISFGLVTDDSYDSITGSRDTVRLNVEEKSSKYIPLTVNPVGNVADGYKLGSVSSDMNRVEISGPKSVVSKVAKALVNIDVSGASSSISANVDIKLFDTANREISENVKLQTEYVHVDAMVLETKLVPIYAGRVGTPADGYLYTGNLTIDPDQVRIAGPSSTLAGVTRITISDPVDITDAKTTVEKTFHLEMYTPYGVSFASEDFDGNVTVTVPIEEMVYKTISVPVANLTLENVPEDLKLEITDSKETVSVRVGGLQDEMEALDPAILTGTIDVGAWMKEQGLETLNPKSVYEMPVELVFEGSLRAMEAISAQVRIAPEED